MSIAALIKDIENWFHGMVGSLKHALDYVEANGGSAAIALGESVLAGFATGTPWATIVAEMLKQAETQGIALAEGAASIVLNLAKANVDAKAAQTAVPAVATNAGVAS